MNKYNRIIFLLFIILTCSFSITYAHPGMTDGSGGHYVRGTGTYHFHHEYPAHNHTNGSCPYSFDNKTGLNSNTSYSAKSGSNNVKGNIVFSDSPFGLVINHPIISGMTIFVIYSSFKSKIERKKLLEIEKAKAKKFEEEKLYYERLFEGKSILELANVPDNIIFGKDDLQIAKDSSGLTWGKEFTVYTTKSGQCYHRKHGCCGAQNETHIFKIRFRGCSKCTNDNNSSPNNKYPKWYTEYIKLKRIKTKYKLSI